MLNEEIISQLRQNCHKVTPQRVLIIKTINASKELLTPTELYEKVHQIDPEVGEVTVYRTLNILSELGLICMIHTGENTHSYIGRPIEHHGHIICTECGKVVDFSNCNLDELEKRLMNETGYNIQEHRLDFYGKCQECLKSKK
jgi:Fur family transcriptional regulator, ferric uptake regulator